MLLDFPIKSRNREGFKYLPRQYIHMFSKPLKKVIKWGRKESPWILHINTGSCNGCDIELLDTLTPRFDIEQLGAKQVSNPRHADILLVTGPVTKQMEPRLKRLYNQTPQPKSVVAIGSCACSGGVFHNCYNTLNGVDEVIPVDVYIPGCPVTPEKISEALKEVNYK